jgi:phosphatidyl-myo-inositol dimannoside synthase
MRILYMTPGCFDKGGISRYCRYQIQAARQLEDLVDITVLSMMGPDGQGFEVPFHVDWHGAPRINLFGRVRLALTAIWTALVLRPHVVHIAHVNYSPLAVFLSRLVGARTLLNVYGLEIWSRLSPHRRRSMRSMDRVIADCHFTASYVVDAGLHAVRPVVVWDCVDPERFSPGCCPDDRLRKYGIPPKSDSFVVLTLGRLSKGAAHKGYDRLIRAFASVAGKVAKAILIIAGKGDLRPELEELAESLGLERQVRFIGPVDEEDLADVYRSASVFSLVSDRGPGRGEGIPLTPLEAMACGIPIIVGNHDGSQEAIVGGENGFVIDPFDEAKHVEVLCSIAESEELAERLSRGARRVAVEEFGYQGFKYKHRDIYSEIAKTVYDH